MVTVQAKQATVKPFNKGFYNDVLQGLKAPEKYLHSKYFYDEAGDRLFQKIMACPEYYLTRCEMEIFTQQTGRIAQKFVQASPQFDVIELGAGDATKSIYLLEELLKKILLLHTTLLIFRRM